MLLLLQYSGPFRFTNNFVRLINPFNFALSDFGEMYLLKYKGFNIFLILCWGLQETINKMYIPPCLHMLCQVSCDVKSHSLKRSINDLVTAVL